MPRKAVGEVKTRQKKGQGKTYKPQHVIDVSSDEFKREADKLYEAAEKLQASFDQLFYQQLARG